MGENQLLDCMCIADNIRIRKCVKNAINYWISYYKNYKKLIGKPPSHETNTLYGELKNEAHLREAAPPLFARQRKSEPFPRLLNLSRGTTQTTLVFFPTRRTR